jgi:hypothetical protein
MEKGEKKRIVRFLLSAVSIFGAVSLFVASVSYAVDPAHLFDPAYDVEVARGAIEIIKTGQNVANMENYNERMVKRYAVYELPAAHTVVLGSSRAAMISEDMAGGGSFFNYSVTGASVYDIVGMYGLLYGEGKLPGRVIISLDMWWLNDNYDSERFDGVMSDGYLSYASGRLGYGSLPFGWREVPERYSDPDYQTGGKTAPWRGGRDALKELFSLPYFQSSVGEIFDDSAAPAPTGEYLGERGILRADGSYGYPKNFRESAPAAVAERADEWLPRSVLGCENYALSGDEAKTLFRDFVASLVDDGIEVDFILTPVNPIVYGHMESHARYARAIEAEGWFLTLAGELGIDAAGSFDPDLVGAGPTDFYDASHYHYQKVAELVARVN